MVPERNNLKHIPRPPIVTPPLDSLPEQDKQIYRSNNIRLDQLEEQLHDISTFGGACDELIVWLNDSRAYNQYNENSLIACIATIYENAKEFGLWSGCNILKLAANQPPSSLSKAGRAFIKQCYIEMHTTHSGRRPSDASVNSVHSPMPASPSIGIPPQSPVTNHGIGSPSFNHVARSVHDTNFLSQSPVSVTSSPHTSPFFSNSTANPTSNDNIVDTTPSIAIPHHHDLQQFLTRKQMDELYRQQQSPQVRQQNPNYVQNTFQNGTVPNQQMLAAQTHFNTFYPSQRGHIQQQQQQHLQPPQQQYQQKQAPQYHQQQQQMAAMAALSRLNPQEQTQLYNQHLQQQIRQNQYRHQQHQQQHQQQVAQQQQLAQHQSQIHLLAQQQQQIQQHQMQQRMVNQLLRTTNGNTSNASTTSNGSSSNPTTPTTPGFPQDFHVFPPAQTTPTRNNVSVPSSQAPKVSSVQLVSPGVTTTTQTVTPSITVPTTAPPALSLRTTVRPPNPPATVRLTVLPPKPPGTVRTTQPTTPSTSTPIHPRIPPATAPTTAQPSTGPPRPTITPIPSTYNTNNLHLPGGGQSKSMISFSTNPNADKLRFKFKAGYAVKPFILEHEGRTRKQFFLGSEDFERIWKGPETTFQDTNGKVALTFVLNCHFLNTAEQKCDWPDSLVADLNGRQLPLVRRIRHVTPTGATYQGKDHPFDFTSIVHRGSNTVTLTRNRNTNGKSYIFSVQIYNRFSENHIRNLVKASSIDISETESLLFRLLGKNSQNKDEDDIVVLQDSIKVNLKCPITMTRIQNPVRGKKCKHINCFDLSNYITLNDLATPTWKCPHCSIEVGPEQLARDLFTEKLLTELPKHATEIEYTKNTSSYSITKVDDVDDGEDSGDEEQPMKIETPPVKPPEKTVDVIDLISDDESEDDEPLAKRMRL